MVGDRVLPEALDLLFTDEPYIDFLADVPWRVPDGVVKDLTSAVDGLVADTRSARLTLDTHPRLRTPAPAVVAELCAIIDFLGGAGSVRGGPQRALEYRIAERFLNGRSSALAERPWFTGVGSWRPPGGPLLTAAGNDPELRRFALDLTREVLDVLDGLAPLDTRRRALSELYEQAMADTDLTTRTLQPAQQPFDTGEVTDLTDRWASRATDEMVAAVPELTGPVGYLSWLVDGWCAVHERLHVGVPGVSDLHTMLGELLLAAGLSEPPPELAVGVRGELYPDLYERMPSIASTWNEDRWEQRVRSWLARALVAGDVSAARTWLDLSARITAAVQALPGVPAGLGRTALPLEQFHHDMRHMFRVRTVRHPLSVAPSFTVPVSRQHRNPNGRSRPPIGAGVGAVGSLDKDGRSPTPEGAGAARALNGVRPAAVYPGQDVTAPTSEAVESSEQVESPGPTDDPDADVVASERAEPEGVVTVSDELSAYDGGSDHPVEERQDRQDHAPGTVAADTPRAGSDATSETGPEHGGSRTVPADEPPAKAEEAARSDGVVAEVSGGVDFEPEHDESAQHGLHSGPDRDHQQDQDDQQGGERRGPEQHEPAQPVSTQPESANPEAERTHHPSVGEPPDAAAPFTPPVPDESVTSPEPAPAARTDGTESTDATTVPPDSAGSPDRMEPNGEPSPDRAAGAGPAPAEPPSASPNAADSGDSMVGHPRSTDPIAGDPLAAAPAGPPPGAPPAGPAMSHATPSEQSEQPVAEQGPAYGPASARPGHAGQPGQAGQPGHNAELPSSEQTAEPAHRGSVSSGGFQPVPVSDETSPDALAAAYRVIEAIVGQPALIAALREAAGTPEHAVRLLVAGPPGTGRGMTIDALTKILAVRGFSGAPVRLNVEEFERMRTPEAAIGHLRERLGACQGERLVAIDGLDRLVSNEHNGRALATELQHLITTLGGRLQIVGFCASDGYRRIVDANAALAAWWRVVRTRDFDADDFTLIFARVVERRGASVTEQAARSAGELLAATPVEGELQNARLATYLADLAISAASRRSGHAARPTVDVPDLPPLRPSAARPPDAN